MYQKLPEKIEKNLEGGEIGNNLMQKFKSKSCNFGTLFIIEFQSIRKEYIIRRVRSKVTRDRKKFGRGEIECQQLNKCVNFGTPFIIES